MSRSGPPGGAARAPHLSVEGAKIRITDCENYESVTRFYRGLKQKGIWLGWLDLNQRMTESESVALPLGDTPVRAPIIPKSAKNGPS